MTPDQIQQLRQQYGYNPSSLNLNTQGTGDIQSDEVNKRMQTVFGGTQETSTPSSNSILDFGKGLVKSVGNTANNINRMAEPVMNAIDVPLGKVAQVITGRTPEEQALNTQAYQQSVATDMAKREQLAQTHNTAQDLGKVTGDIAQYAMLPGAKGGAVARMGTNFATGAGLNAAQGGTTGENLLAGSLNALVPEASNIYTALKGIKDAKKAQAIVDLVSPRLTPSVAAEAKVTNPEGVLGTIKEVVPQRVKDVAETVKDIVNPKKTFSENKNLVQNAITEKAQGLISKLKEVETQVGKDRGFFTPNQFKSYMNEVKTQLADNPTLVGGDAEKTANKILDKFTSLVKEKGHTPSGLLEARKALDNWVKSFKGEKIFDPATENAMSSALRAIRQGGNDFLSKLVPDVNVKELLAEQSKMYDALETISEKVAKGELRTAGEIGSNRITRVLNKNPKKTQAAKYAGATIGGAVLGGGAYGALKGLTGN